MKLIKYILKVAMDNAHEMDGVIIIEVRKNQFSPQHVVSHSGMRAETLLRALRLAAEKIEKKCFAEDM
jgi:hypothetical protein